MAQRSAPEQPLVEMIGVKDYLSRYYFFEQQLSGNEIEYLHFDDCEFDSCYFNNEGMHNIVFDNCYFYDCRFNHQTLRDCQFNDCRFYHPDKDTIVDFSFAELVTTKFLRCDLTRVNFYHASLYGTELKQCKMVGVNFDTTTFSHMISKKVSVNHFSVNDCNLSYSTFKNVNLSQCEMLDTNFQGATFSNCDLDQMNFQGSILCNTIFDTIAGHDIDMRYAQLANINISPDAIKHLIISNDACATLLTALGCLVE